MHLTWLNNNSWLIEMANQRILLDPWLVGPLVFGNLTWLIKGQLTQPQPIPEQIDLILLSQGIEDHTHPETLQQLDHHLPVIASPNAAKTVRAMGFTRVTALAHGEITTVGERLKLQALPGTPLGPLLVENGYILTDTLTSEKLYYEPHGNHASELKALASVDVVITPVVDLEIPLLGAIIKGRKSAVKVAKWLQPRVMLPTAAGGNVRFEGALASVLRERGSVEEFRDQLHQEGLTTQVFAPKPGERLEV